MRLQRPKNQENGGLKRSKPKYLVAPISFSKQNSRKYLACGHLSAFDEQIYSKSSALASSQSPANIQEKRSKFPANLRPNFLLRKWDEYAWVSYVLEINYQK